MNALIHKCTNSGHIKKSFTIKNPVSLPRLFVMTLVQCCVAFIFYFFLFWFTDSLGNKKVVISMLFIIAKHAKLFKVFSGEQMLCLF